MAYTVSSTTNYCAANQGGNGLHEPMTVEIDSTDKEITFQERAATDDGDSPMLNVRMRICKHCRSIYYVDKVDYSDQ